MINPRLVTPDIKYERSYLMAFGEPGIGRGDTQLMMPEKDEAFAQFVKRLVDESKGINLKAGRVPSTTLWLVDGDEFIGRLSIRHELNDKLRKIGGHIGYLIRPSKRRMGYGKKILELGLLESKHLGIKNVLVTCDIDNIASQKIIEAHGGKLENSVEEGHRKLHRFWIDL